MLYVAGGSWGASSPTHPALHFIWLVLPFSLHWVCNDTASSACFTVTEPRACRRRSAHAHPMNRAASSMNIPTDSKRPRGQQPVQGHTTCACQSRIRTQDPNPGLAVYTSPISQWTKLTCQCYSRELGMGWTLESASLTGPQFGQLGSTSMPQVFPSRDISQSFRGPGQYTLPPTDMCGCQTRSPSLPQLMDAEMIRAGWPSEPIQLE